MKQQPRQINEIKSRRAGKCFLAFSLSMFSSFLEDPMSNSVAVARSEIVRIFLGGDRSRQPNGYTGPMRALQKPKIA
jgi:hypothetical protein